MVNNRDLSWERFLEIKKSLVDFVPLNVVTGSMEPLIPVGGKVIVDKKTPFKVNDIIVFWHDKKLIVHILWNSNSKIHKNGKKIFVTRSLKSRALDTSVNEEQILGKVVNFKLRWRDLFRLYVLNRPKSF